MMTVNKAWLTIGVPDNSSPAKRCAGVVHLLHNASASVSPAFPMLVLQGRPAQMTEATTPFNTKVALTCWYCCFMHLLRIGYSPAAPVLLPRYMITMLLYC